MGLEINSRAERCLMGNDFMKERRCFLSGQPGPSQDLLASMIASDKSCKLAPFNQLAQLWSFFLQYLLASQANANAASAFHFLVFQVV